MPDIQITVRNKIAQTQNAPEIVCGNSDYTAIFDFDAEWSDYDAKTARFVWRDNRTGKMRHWDAQFEGGSATVPAVYGTSQMLIGVYAGNIRTTTPARVPCIPCITDDAPAHDPPDDDVYAQLLDYLSKLEPESGGIGAVGDVVPEASGVMQATVGYAYFIRSGNYDFQQETNDDAKESTTLTANLRENGLLIAAVMHRDENVSISGEGWTLVKKSQPASYGGASQWVSVWTKQAAAGSYSVTVTQGSSTNMSVKLIALYGAQSLTAVDDTVLQTSTYTPPAVTGKRRLYMISAVYAKSGGDSFDVSNYGTLDIQAMTEQRFMVWYDYQPSLQVTPTFVYRAAGSFDPNEASALVFDIEEG